MPRPAPPHPTAMLVVRHGQTTWNATHRWQGRADSPLSSLGVAQAEWAARELDGFDVVITSSLSRARATGAILASAMGVPAIADDELVERDVGDWTGLTSDEIEAAWPGALAEHRHPNGWETDEQVAARGAQALQRIAKEHEGRSVVVVTHGGLVRALERSLDKVSAFLPNLAGVWVTVTDDGLHVSDRVELIDHAAVAATVPDSE